MAKSAGNIGGIVVLMKYLLVTKEDMQAILADHPSVQSEAPNHAP